MVRQTFFAIFFSAVIVAGCQCNGCGQTVSPDVPDSGDDGGEDASVPPSDNFYPDGGVIPPDSQDNFPPDGGFTFDGGQGGTGERVTTNPGGGIVLNPTDDVVRFAWIANSYSGWVSKYDTSGILPDGGLRESARYYSVIPVDGTGAAVNVRPDTSPTTNSPSRTAIDLFGDVWIANRAPDNGTQGSVTKIANDPAGCIDRNGNSTIETSRDVNGNGIIEPAVPGEFIQPADPNNPATYDECVLFSTPVGGTGSGVKSRGLAVSQGIEGGSAGDIWVVLHNQQSVVKLSSLTGAVQPTAGGAMSIPIGFGGYGAAVDRQQRLWVISTLSNRLALINTVTGSLVNNNITPPGTIKDQFGADYTGGVASYGIAIDGQDRVWLAGFDRWGYAFRYDHSNTTWTAFNLRAANCHRIHGGADTQIGRGRGITVDTSGIVWMGADKVGGSGTDAAQLIGFNGNTGAIFPLGPSNWPCVNAQTGSAPNTNLSIGVGLDQDDNLWINNYDGNVMRVERTTGQVNESVNQGGNLYSYSDFTGYQLRNFTSPFGRYVQLLQGCAPETEWRSLTWAAVTPPKTRIDVFLRVANTVAGLNTTPTIYGPFTQSGVGANGEPAVTPTFPIDLTVVDPPTDRPVIKAKFMRVEFQLRTAEEGSSPVLNSFAVGRDCEVLIP